MTASTNKLLFSWDDVEYLPDLQRLEFVLRYLPDEDLLRALNGKRGRGRDDYPVEAMWRALVAGVVFQHPSIAALIRELRRNPALLGLCGFNPLPRQGRPVLVREATADAQVPRLVPAPLHDSVPGDANFSRLLRNLVDLEEHQGLVSAMVDTLRKRLIEALPDFGKHLGYDGKAIDSHSTGRTSRKTGKTSDPDADWGKHETFGTDHKTGKVWKKVKSWFGYGLHLIADTSYEIRKRKINPTPALRQNLCASGVGIPLPLTDQENLGYDLIRKGWENGSQRLTRRAVEISRARIIGQIRESGYVERKGDRDVPCFFRFCRNDPRRRPPCREAVQRQSPLVRWRCGSRSDRYVPRQQRFDLFHAAGPGQLGEHLTQILIGLQSIGLGGLHQAVEVGAGLDPLYAVAEQPVFAAHDKGTDRVFGQVVVDGDSPVVQITDQPGPFVLQVVERLADGGFRWRLRQCLV